MNLSKKIVFLLLIATSQVFSQGLDKAIKKQFKNLPYLITTPVNYEKNNTYPTIIFLHGGDRSNVKHHPSKYASWSKIDFPFIVLAPSCTSGCSWSNVDLAGLLNQASKEVSIDEKRVYLIGYSMGGAGTWNNLKKISNLLAAATPIAPAGGNTSGLCKVKNLPIRVYHGTSDYGYNNSQKMIQELKKCGSSKAELIALKGKGHGIWPAIFSDAKYYSWLLEHSK